MINWKLRFKLAIAFLCFFVIISSIYFAVQEKYKDPLELDKLDSISSIVMAPSNSIAKIIYVGMFRCNIVVPDLLSETCFHNYKLSLAISLVPGVIIYYIIGFLIGLIIEKINRELERPKNLVDEIKKTHSKQFPHLNR